MREAWTGERLDDLTERMEKDFRRVDERFDQVDRRFDKIDARFDAVDARFDSLQQTIIAVGGGLIGTFIVASAAIVATQL
jgi:hypothetical protein